jgi:hypothetical protein
MFLDAVYSSENGNGLTTLNNSGIIEKVKDDLLLGRFSHTDALSDTSQIVGNPISLSNINNAGPFAGLLDTLPYLKTAYYPRDETDSANDID